MNRRVIKFRAWDRKRGCMIGNDYPSNWNNDKDEWYADWAMMEIQGITEMSERDDFVLMQFTGLQDKNSREIYEGDLCRFTTRDSQFQTRYGHVQYVRSEFRALIEGDDEDDSLSLNRYYEIEVIGNIYENPDMIKPR